MGDEYRPHLKSSSAAAKPLDRSQGPRAIIILSKSGRAATAEGRVGSEYARGREEEEWKEEMDTLGRGRLGARLGRGGCGSANFQVGMGP